MKILLTGGLGYIGSHICVELLGKGYRVVVIDDLSNSSRNVTNKIKYITGKNIKFYKGDVKDKEILRRIFKENKIAAVVHLAGFKSVNESVLHPMKYYRNNLDCSINLLEVMQEVGVKNIVFSSSAAVYGEVKELPIKESSTLHATNPYGYTKIVIEQMLNDLYKSDNEWSVMILRYFNPIGAHRSGLLGENINGIPNNLMPYIVKVASGELQSLNIFGHDYNTIDGTPVRDYIHVVDLARGHIKGVDKVVKEDGVFIYNLGTGKGYSVLEVVNTFIRVNNIDLKFDYSERRDGDVEEYYADPSLAKENLNWEASYDLEDMCRDSYIITKDKE